MSKISDYYANRPRFPYLIVFKEKHGTRYFLINSIEDRDAFCLNVLTERFSRNWYYYDSKLPDTFEEYFQMTIGISLDEYKALPEAFRKFAGRDNYKDSESYVKGLLRRYHGEKYDNDLYNVTAKAIADKDGAKAFKILIEYSDAGGYDSYSHMGLECFENHIGVYIDRKA